MTGPCDERPQLDCAEEQFVARLAAHYVPKPMPPARRVTWEAALCARLQSPRHRMWLAPALTTGVVAIVVSGLRLPRPLLPTPRGGGRPHIMAFETPRLALEADELIHS